MVIGPTPPGTGVIAAARSFASSNATSPTSFVFFARRGPASMRLMPTSITTAPGFTQSPRIISALPTATTSTSASRQTRGKVLRARVRDRHRRVRRRGGAARSACRRCWSARRRPRERPSSFAPGEREELHEPARRARHEPRAPRREQARVDRMEAVDVLLGGDRRRGPSAPDVLRERELDEDAVDRVVGVEPVEERRAGRPRSCRPGACGACRGCRPRARPSPCCACRPGSRDLRRRGRPRALELGRARRRTSRRPRGPPRARTRPASSRRGSSRSSGLL